LASLLLSGTAAADWAWLAAGDGMTAYFDLSNIRRYDDGYVRLWSLSDLAKPQHSDPNDKKFLSAASQSEFDCVKRQGRLLSYRWYAGNMGKGELVYSDYDPGAWSQPVPESLFAALMRVACGKD
jgi:hypothetical protein